MQVSIEEVFEVLLAAGGEFGFAEFEGDFLEVLEAEFLLLDVPAEAGVEAAVPILDEGGEFAVGQNPAGGFKRQGVSVHAADVGVEQIGRICRGAAQLGVEVEPAAAETARAQDRNHGESEFFDVGVKLVGVPAQQHVAGVGIDGAEHAVGGGDFDLMIEGVAGERGVVGLDVELEVLVEFVGAQEGDPGGHVEVVLVLGRLLGLGLDQELTGEADLLGVVDRQVQETSEVILFALHVGVEQGFITLAAAPEHVVLSAELNGTVHGLLHLGGRIGENMGVRIGSPAAHVAGVREEIGRAPQQFDP